MRYLLGIDGGGTNSRLLAVDERGNKIGASRGKSTNVESNSPSVVLHNLKLLLNSFLSTYGVKPEDCAGICFGTAGVDSETTRRTIEQMLEGLPLNCKKKVVNDAVIALYANTRGKPGVMLISGTGSIAYGINGERRIWRAGGFDYLVGDEGSAYWVARRGLTAALRAYDETGEPTCMLNDFCKHLRLHSADEIVDYVYSHNKSDLASLSIVVSEAAGKGDPMAVKIMDEAAQELACLVRTVLRKLSMSGGAYPLLLGGGFLLHDARLRERLISLLAREEPALHIAQMKNKAEWGAIYMAAELAGIEWPETEKSGTE